MVYIILINMLLQNQECDGIHIVTEQTLESHDAPSAQTPSTASLKAVILLISILQFCLFFVQNFDLSY